MQNKMVPSHILEVVKKNIDQFSLLSQHSPEQPLPVAVSGGKDSLFALITLRELGYEVQPLVVDMGYEVGWGQKVTNLVKELHFENTWVLEARDKDFQSKLSNYTKKQLTERLTSLDTTNFTENRNLTPCTFCYNSKATILEWALAESDNKLVIFGHHGTDAVASLLKSLLMYKDRWENKQTQFSWAAFSQFIDHIFEPIAADPAGLKAQELMNQCLEAVLEGRAGTDEPPLQKFGGKSHLYIVRPLYPLLESSVIQFKEDYAIKTEGSGCGHGATKDTQTPREMIHYRWLQKLEQTSQGRDWILALNDIVSRNLTAQGEVRINVRNQRAELLGESYKGGSQLRKV